MQTIKLIQIGAAGKPLSSSGNAISAKRHY